MSDLWPSMATHTQNLCSAFYPSKCTHTHTHTHTHTVNMGLDRCHNSALEISYFKHAKFCGENVHLRKKKVFQRTKNDGAFKICFWICADLLFCVCSVSLACSPDARSQCSLHADRSLAQHSTALQCAIIPANQRRGC